MPWTYFPYHVQTLQWNETYNLGHPELMGGEDTKLGSRVLTLQILV